MIFASEAKEAIVSINHLESWVLAQVGLEVALIFLLAFFLVRIRALDKLLQNYNQEGAALKTALSELTEKMASWEKRQTDLEETLYNLRGLGELQTVLPNKSAPLGSQTTGADPPANPSPRKPSLRLQVENLHLQGFTPAEIARHLGLHPSEVKMALELSRLKRESA